MAKIILDIQSLTLGRPIPPAQRALFIPDFLTDRLNPIRKPQADILKKTSSNTPQRIPAWETWRKTYVFLEKQNNKDENQWHSLDLTHLANHSMTRERGWLGADPLLHFSPGLRSVHEIPFEVIDGKKNSGQSVVTFKSPHTHSNKGTPLPSNVKLKLHKTVKALYFLHACGWVKWQEPFAEYIVHFKNGRTSKNPLIPVGSSRHPSHKQSTRLKPNIQDWWRSEEAQDFPHAMYAMVYNPAVPLEYERLLYTLEWINPHPKEEISFIEIEVDPNAGPTLALIAVTALL